MKALSLLLTIALLLISISPLHAQDDDICDIEALAADYGTRISAAITLEELNELNRELSIAIADCTPRPTSNEDSLVLDGTEAEATMGPLEIEAGYYLVEVNLIWDETAQNTILDARFEHDIPFSIMAGYAAEDTIHREIRNVRSGGTYFVNIETTGTEDWSITFTPIDYTQTVDALTLSAEGVDADFIGPIELEAGFYKIEYSVTRNDLSPDSTSYMFIHWVSFSGTVIGLISESERGDFSGEEVYNISDGIYYINIDTSSASEWTVTITPQ